MLKNKGILLFILFAVCFAAVSTAQNITMQGRINTRHFSINEYGSAGQIWTGLQAANGNVLSQLFKASFARESMMSFSKRPATNVDCCMIDNLRVCSTPTLDSKLGIQNNCAVTVQFLEVSL